MLCLSAAAGVVPIAGGAIANLGATVGILFALGVGRNISLASGLLLITSATAAALVGLGVSVATRSLTRQAAAA